MMTMIDSGLNHISIHVLSAGSGEGESIIVELPDNRWGVVDCYARFLDSPQTNPTWKFLKDRGVQRLGFLCLTHPHRDHYRGMSHILDDFPIDWFWRSEGMSGQRLKWLLYYQDLHNEEEHFEENIPDSNEFFKILDLVQEKRKANGLKQKTLSINKHLFPMPFNSRAELQILSIAPPDGEVLRYEQTLTGCFVKNKLKDKLPHYAHNIISSALLIKFGRTCIILGGDVEKTAWKQILQEVDVDDLACHIVKISHHGSTNGYTSTLWDHFGREVSPIAIATPFTRFDLPKEEALQHISQFTEYIMVTNMSALHASVKLESQIAQRYLLKMKHTHTSQVHGRCSLTFDNNGNLVTSICDGLAGVLGDKVDIPLQQPHISSSKLTPRKKQPRSL